MVRCATGGPQSAFSPAISFFVNCETQQGGDELRERLSASGEKQRVAVAQAGSWKLTTNP
ncbi:MAG: VOC family protein [Burkholderiales bacterium]